MALFGDWRDTHEALLKGYECVGEAMPDNVDRREWAIVDAAIKADREARRLRCLMCRRLLMPAEEIRCLDCKSVLCEGCAPGHFWPERGRKPETLVRGAAPGDEKVVLHDPEDDDWLDEPIICDD